MVTKSSYREVLGGPPPMDEAWWESLMAEEEDAPPPVASAVKPPLAACPRVAPIRMNDSPAVNWDKALTLYQHDGAICLEVSGFNRGGLLVNGEGLQGFVPISHLIEPLEDETDLERCLQAFVGRTLRLKVIECDPERGRVVFSERAALAEPGSRNYLLEHLQPGDCVPGSVTNITEFGVFVDLGGVEGLIHVSEISWGRVHHPADVVKLGQAVTVHVINVDQKRARVGLSLKRLYPNPWETAEQRYHAGQITDAVVTSLVQFGAFARLEEGLDGLIHVSEIFPSDHANPAGRIEDVLHEGQRVQVRVLHVDGPRQRLGLSLRIDPEPE